MDEHSFSAQLKRSGPTMRHRLRLLAYCLLTTNLATNDSGASARAAPKRLSDPDDTDDGARLAQSNVLLLLRQVVETQSSTSLRSHVCVQGAGAPRFLFAVGPKGVVVRSADRGVTWRPLKLDAAETSAAVEQENHSKVICGDDGTSLKEIIDLLPAGGEVGAESSGGSSEDDDEVTPSQAPTTSSAPSSAAATSSSAAPPPPPDPTQSDLQCVTTNGDLVAVCGSDGLLAVSADRGVKFTMLSRTSCTAIKDRTKSKRQFLTLHRVRFIGNDEVSATSTSEDGVESQVLLVRQRLLLQTSHSVLTCSLDWQPSTQRIVAFRPLELLHRFQNPIGCMEVSVESSSSSTSDQFVVSVALSNVLYLSFDEGRSFVSCPHRLGILRDLIAVPYGNGVVLPPSLQHPSPDGARVAMESIGESNEAVVSRIGAAAAAASGQPQQPKYMYDVSSAVSPSSSKTGLLMSDNKESPQSVLARWHQQFCDASFTSNSTNEIVWRAWFVLATEGRVVPYDCTAILFVAVHPELTQPSEVRVRMVTMPKHVDHLAFVQSGVVERVGMDVLAQRHDPTSAATRLVWIRSTSSGVSYSTDVGLTWSTPEKSFTGTVVELDEGCVRVATQRRSVLHGSQFGRAMETVTMPTALKLTNVHDLAVMR